MLLLLPNLLFGENVVSKPTVMVSTEDLYNRVVEQSHITYNLAADVFHEFDVKFFKRSWFTHRGPRLCHTASIPTPGSLAEINETNTEDLLKAIINISLAWEEPLKHLVSALAALPGGFDEMVKIASNVKDRNRVLLEGLETILSRNQTEVEENAYPAWSGLDDLQSSDEDTHLFAMYMLCRCLKRDTHKIDTYLKVLRCRVAHKNAKMSALKCG
ncbi:prolactin-3D4 isoform X1, partial [Sigmodon hispidus]